MKYILYILTFSIVFVSCMEQSDVFIPAGEPTDNETLNIVYMIADNNLAESAIDNINKMESSLPNEDVNLIVYCDIDGQKPKILKILKDNTPEIKSKVIKLYDEHNSSSPTIMNAILTSIKKDFPSERSGLILWSHSSAWLPTRSNGIAANINGDIPGIHDKKSLSFGDDNGKEMNTVELAKAIPLGFDYVIFDSCLMGNIESAYDLKEKAPYILASPTETLADGMPYHRITRLLFEDVPIEKRLKKIGQAYFDYYNTELYEKNLNDVNMKTRAKTYRTATISLIKTKELDNLAKETSKIINGYILTPWEYRHDEIQKLDNSIGQTKLYDLLDFFERNYGKEITANLRKQLNKTVIFKKNTEYFLRFSSKGDYKIENYSGLSCYVPLRNQKKLNKFYMKLNWPNKSGFISLISNQ